MRDPTGGRRRSSSGGSGGDPKTTRTRRAAGHAAGRGESPGAEGLRPPGRGKPQAAPGAAPAAAAASAAAPAAAAAAPAAARQRAGSPRGVDAKQRERRRTHPPETFWKPCVALRCGCVSVCGGIMLLVRIVHTHPQSLCYSGSHRANPTGSCLPRMDGHGCGLRLSGSCFVSAWSSQLAHNDVLFCWPTECSQSVDGRFGNLLLLLKLSINFVSYHSKAASFKNTSTAHPTHFVSSIHTSSLRIGRSRGTVVSMRSTLQAALP